MRSSHGHAARKSTTTTYNSWRGMMNRVGRAVWYKSVKVCPRWRSFANFLADMGERPPGTTLDRKDSGGDYEPGNCRWATPKEQTANRRKGVRLTPEMASQIRNLRQSGTSGAALAKRFGVSQNTISAVCTGKTWKR